MRSSARSALPTLLTLFCFAASVFAQSLGKQAPAKTPRGSISGRVTIKDKPAPGLVVGLRKNEVVSAYEPFTKAVTDADGVYRITNLAPGTYSRFQMIFKQVFHPDVSDSAKATIVEVSEGSEASNVDVSLGRPVQVFSVSGRVINSETGMPVPNMRFGLQRLLGQRFEFVSTVVASNARGDFIVEGLAAGEYGVALFFNEKNDMQVEISNFDVIDQDVTGVVIKLSKGASISGMVVLESEDKAAQSKLTQMQMRGFVQTSVGYGSSSNSPVAADGSFRLGGLSTGYVNISLGATTGPYPLKGFSISRIERDGIVSPRIEVKGGEQIAGVKVFVGYGNATLRGVVNIENGPLPIGCPDLCSAHEAGRKRFLSATSAGR